MGSIKGFTIFKNKWGAGPGQGLATSRLEKVKLPGEFGEFISFEKKGPQNP